MPMNLIEQQNQLRGLPDDALPKQMQSGSVPPFLVLSEINRRKTARERYEAQASKYKAAQPTVAEELLGAAAPRGLDAAAMMGGQPQAAPQGIAAAMPQMDAMATPPGYANGGMVGGYANGGAVGYAGGGLADILKIYQDRYAKLGDPNKQALKAALMSIGAGMVGGGSANFMKNVGAGLSAGVPVYQNTLANADEEALKLLNAQADIEQSMSRERQAELDRQAEAQYRTQNLDIQRAGLAPAPVREAQWLMGATDEEKAAYDKVTEQNQSAEDARAASAFNSVKNRIARTYIDSMGNPTNAVPSDIADKLMSADPTVSAKARADLDALIRRQAVDEYSFSYPDYAAYADRYAGMIEQAAPEASTGGGGTGTMWTDYFNR